VEKNKNFIRLVGVCPSHRKKSDFFQVKVQSYNLAKKNLILSKINLEKIVKSFCIWRGEKLSGKFQNCP